MLSLYERSNLRDTLYSVNKACSLSLIFQDNSLDLPNKFFWMTKDAFLNIPELPQELHDHCHESDERFAAQWFKNNSDALSDDCQELLLLSKELVKVTIKDLLKANKPELQLNRWDAGWVQLKKELFDNKSISKVGKIDNEDDGQWLSYKNLHKIIKKRLQPYVYEFGVLEKEDI